MAAGAVAGAAAGLYLGRRYRSMDAFVEDMRDKFESLRDVWYDADLLDRRSERVAVGDDDLDEDDEEGEYGDIEDDDLDDAPYETEEVYHEDVFDEEDELEEELAAVGRGPEVSPASQRAAHAARQLEERVLGVMRDDAVLRTRNIEIAVVGDGVVELTGNVQTIDEVSRAAAAVRDTAGVSMVLNRLEVRSGGSIETASVAREQSTGETGN